MWIMDETMHAAGGGVIRDLSVHFAYIFYEPQIALNIKSIFKNVIATIFEHLFYAGHPGQTGKVSYLLCSQQCSKIGIILLLFYHWQKLLFMQIHWDSQGHSANQQEYELLNLIIWLQRPAFKKLYYTKYTYFYKYSREYCIQQYGRYLMTVTESSSRENIWTRKWKEHGWEKQEIRKYTGRSQSSSQRRMLFKGQFYLEAPASS